MTTSPDFKPLKMDAARSHTLPGHIYYRPDVLEHEISRIFARSWQIVAHQTEMANAGDYVTAEIASEPIFVIRDDEGQLRAFYNVCQHRAHTLLRGTGNVNSVIVCPYHAWTYTKSGALRTARHTKNLPDLDPSEYGLVEVRLETACGFVFVNLDPEAAAIEETWPGFVDSVNQHLPWWPELSIHSRSDGDTHVELAANWKVLAENCRECYHCRPAHPAFVDLVDMDKYQREYHEGWMYNLAPLNRADNEAYTVGPEKPVQQGMFWHLWPNNEIGVSLGEKSMAVFRYYPSGPETTRSCTITTAVSGVGIEAECSDYIWNTLWPEDESLCVAVHQGLKSRGYRQGRFVVDDGAANESERGVHEFQRQYAHRMGLTVMP